MRLQTSAYDAGYDAYFDHVPREDCPYDEYSDVYHEWIEGWDTADSDDDSGD